MVASLRPDVHCNRSITPSTYLEVENLQDRILIYHEGNKVILYLILQSYFIDVELLLLDPHVTFEC